MAAFGDVRIRESGKRRDRARTAVRDRFGIELREEIVRLGDFAAD
jgi:hypothetical protein